MAEIKGTNVASKIVPYTDSDEYATHDEKYGVGGYRTVDSVSEMNAIPAARRKEGMLVYVKGDKIYKLNNSNTFVDAGLGGSSGGIEPYLIDINYLNLNNITNGNTATSAELAEMLNIFKRWTNNYIPIYIPDTTFQDEIAYCGVFNVNICNAVISFSVILNNIIRLYSLDLNTNRWSITDIEAGGSSNIKVLTTSSLFERNRNNAITLNANDTTIIKSLFNNQYKNVQLYYLGANSIYPVNVYSASFSSTSPSTGNMVFLSTTSETGVPNAEVITYSNSTNTFKTGSNSQISNEIVVDNYNLSQNGYVKFQTGLMIQWGRVGGSSTASYSVTMPTSFYNTEYKIFATVYKPRSDSAIYSASPIATNKTVSRFYLNRNYASGGTTGLSQESWDWFAIGRWK
jgi:hypothetical protein